MKLKTVVAWAITTSTSTISSINGSQWPPLNQFTFSLNSPSDTTTLNGCWPTQCNLEDNGAVPNLDEQFGAFALYSTRYVTGACFPWSPNCSSDYLIEKGEIDNGSGVNNIPAYLVHPAATPATNFVASKSSLMFQFSAPLASSYDVIKFIPGENGTAGSFSRMDTITPTNVGEWYTTTSHIHQLQVPTVYFAIPSANAPSIWPNASSGTTTTKATVFELNTQGVHLSLKAQLFDVSSLTPFNPELDWSVGPSAHTHKYSNPKTFTRVIQSGNAGDGVIWQDESSLKIYLTLFIPSGHTTIELPNGGTNHLLLCAASDNGINGEVVYMTISQGNAGDGVTPATIKGWKVDSSGSLLISKDYDTSSSQLNVYEFFSSGASLAWDSTSNQIGWILSRQMLNGHQGAISVIVDSSNLNIIVNKGQTTSHSFANYLEVDGSSSNGIGNFLGVDLGDNFPRGIHVHKLSQSSKTSKVVYTFKTQHSTSSSGFPVYPEISTSGTTYYKWSNDNNVYTEIAHPPVVKRNDGSMMIIFAGENPPLDNVQATSNLNAPRNIGLVIVSNDLQSIVSTGQDSSGGFYNFGGGWTSQQNTGIMWLTDFTPNAASTDWESALRIKTAQLANDLILIFYEVWGPSTYKRTDMMAIDLSGSILMNPTTMPYRVRLTPTDKVVLDNGEAIFFGYDSTAGSLVRFHFEIPSAAATTSPSAAATTSPTAAATSSPTAAATSSPTAAATSSPTAAATSSPTAAATSSPTAAATSSPTAAATSSPTAAVATSPTVAATASPTPSSGTAFPTSTPTTHFTPWLAGPTIVSKIDPSIMTGGDNYFDDALHVTNEIGSKVNDDVVVELFDYQCINEKTNNDPSSAVRIENENSDPDDFWYIVKIEQTNIGSDNEEFVFPDNLNPALGNSTGAIKFCTRVSTHEGSIQVAFRETNFVLNYDLTNNTFALDNIQIQENNPDSFITDVDTDFSVIVYQCSNYLQVTAHTLEQDENLVICLEPQHSGNMAHVVHISNFNIKMYAGSVTTGDYVEYNPVWFSTGGWKSDALTAVSEQPDPADIIMISSPVIAQFFIQSHTQIGVSGNCFLEFDSAKGAQTPVFAGYQMEFGVIGSTGEGCLVGLIRRIRGLF